jgi:hypothetical protein
MNGIIFSTDYWSLSLSEEWKHDPSVADGVLIVTTDQTKRIWIRTLLPKDGAVNNPTQALDSFKDIIATAHCKTLNPTHKCYLEEESSYPPYLTLLIASFDEPAHFGIASILMVTPDHQLHVSIHDYFSENQNAFSKLFRNILTRFKCVASDI